MCSVTLPNVTKKSEMKGIPGYGCASSQAPSEAYPQVFLTTNSYEEVIDQEGRSKEMYFGHRAVYKVKRRNVQVFRKTQLHCVNFFKIVDLWCSSYSYYLEYIQIN